MKKAIIILSFFVVFILGFLCSFIITKFQKFTKECHKSTTFSMNTIRDSWMGIYIEIPERAWDVSYHFQRIVMDGRCYLAFSAEEKDIIKIIKGLKSDSSRVTGNSSSSYTQNFKDIPTPKDNRGRVVKWWTDIPIDKLEIHSGIYYWLGYDKVNSRVYFYTFST